jgi:putative addiction module component (TIGR02574 family)
MVDLDLLKDLSVAERILYVEEIWDSIAVDQKVVEITEAQRQELDQRLSNHEENPDAIFSWEEVKARIRSAHE